MKDMHSNIKVDTAITPAAVGTSGAANGKLSGVIDRRGYESVEFVFNYSTAGASTICISTISAAKRWRQTVMPPTPGRW